MNFAAAKTELSNRQFNYLSDARRGQFLNDALSYINSAAPWPWLEQTSTGTAPLTIADVQKVMYVADTTVNSRLKSIDINYLTLIDPALTSTGSPSWWWLDGTTTLRVYPLNTANTITVRYLKYGAKLSADADTPDLPERWHDTWIDCAVVRAYKDANNLMSAYAMQQDVDQQIQQMMMATLNRSKDNAAYIVGVGEHQDN